MTSTPTYVTENEAIISVSVAGVNFPSYIKTWSTYGGGDPSAATSQLLPGNVQSGAIAMPGPVTRSNVTVTLPYSWDIHALVSQIENAVNNKMSAGYTPTDADGNPNGNKPVTRSGILKQPQFPNWDAKSGQPAFLTLIMECDT